MAGQTYTGPNPHADKFFGLTDENAGRAFWECPCGCRIRYRPTELAEHLTEIGD